MKNLHLTVLLHLILFLTSVQSNSLAAQHPCSAPVFHQFDFWIGEWEAFGPKGIKAGDSKITAILDSCIILEEWTSASLTQGLRYAGKSYNKYNPATRQWQQTWVDNTGSSTEYLKGRHENGKMIFETNPFPYKKDTMAIRRLTFYDLGPDKVRQHGELSLDKGNTWVNEYDLEYRRKKQDANQIVDAILRKMEEAYNAKDFARVAGFYSDKGIVIGGGTFVAGKQGLLDYWKSFDRLGGTWQLTNEKTEMIHGVIWQKGQSTITDNAGKKHIVDFTLIFAQEGPDWKIVQDAYW